MPVLTSGEGARLPRESRESITLETPFGKNYKKHRNTQNIMTKMDRNLGSEWHFDDITTRNGGKSWYTHHVAMEMCCGHSIGAATTPETIDGESSHETPMQTGPKVQKNNSEGAFSTKKKRFYCRIEIGSEMESTRDVDETRKKRDEVNSDICKRGEEPAMRTPELLGHTNTFWIPEVFSSGSIMEPDIRPMDGGSTSMLNGGLAVDPAASLVSIFLIRRDLITEDIMDCSNRKRDALDEVGTTTMVRREENGASETLNGRTSRNETCLENFDSEAREEAIRTNTHGFLFTPISWNLFVVVFRLLREPEWTCETCWELSALRGDRQATRTNTHGFLFYPNLMELVLVVFILLMESEWTWNRCR